MIDNKCPQVIIIGAGFAGLSLARHLKKTSVDVLIIDKNNYHTFQPLLYQVATGGLEAENIAQPVRRVFRNNKNIKFRMAEVQSINYQSKNITTSIGTFNYDYLVIATGSENNFFNLAPNQDLLLTLKTVDDALDIRSNLMHRLEMAIAENTDSLEDINIVIVGAGPAGMELAGAFAEMKKYVLRKDFQDLNLNRVQIHLYETNNRLMPAMSERASKASQEYLENLGINIHLDAIVTDYDGELVKLKNGESLRSKIVIWTAGVKAAPIQGLPEDALTKGGRYKVNKYYQTLVDENIFVLGDVAAHVTEDDPRGLPMLASVANQQGPWLAKNITALIKGKSLKPFSYNNRGVMATIGRNKAVADLPHNKFMKGYPAWVAWLFIHLFYLIGFRSKIITLFDWATEYFSYDKPLGIILKKYKK